MTKRPVRASTASGEAEISVRASTVRGDAGLTVPYRTVEVFLPIATIGGQRSVAAGTGARRKNGYSTGR